MTGGPVTRPRRTCIGCRRVQSQRTLLRLVRTADGRVEPDPRGRAGGRGAYLCRRDACLDESLRRARWAHAFRASATMTRETVARLRALIEPGSEPRPPVEGGS